MAMFDKGIHKTSLQSGKGKKLTCYCSEKKKTMFGSLKKKDGQEEDGEDGQ